MVLFFQEEMITVYEWRSNLVSIYLCIFKKHPQHRRDSLRPPRIWNNSKHFTQHTNREQTSSCGEVWHCMITCVFANSKKNMKKKDLFESTKIPKLPLEVSSVNKNARLEHPVIDLSFETQALIALFKSTTVLCGASSIMTKYCYGSK